MNKTIPNQRTSAIHEAGHFCLFLAYCKQLNVQPIFHAGIGIHPGGGYVGGRGMLPIEAARKMLTMPEHREGTIELILQDIRILLAGTAAVILQYDEPSTWLMDKQGTAAVLMLFYDRHMRTPDSDIPRAMELNALIGGEPDILALQFMQTIRDTWRLWTEIKYVAGILDREKTINGTRLNDLIQEVTNTIKI
jgi:hypothetical protein